MESTEEEKVSIWVLLPEQFARRLNISLNRRTPVLDLIVYLSSLFRFNPADFVLGYTNDDEELKGFRVLLPNSCIGASGSSVLQLAEKKHVMSTFFADNSCLRQTYNTSQHPSMKKVPFAPSGYTTGPADVSPSHRQGSGDETISLVVLLPDGRRIDFAEPLTATLGSLFMRICKQNNLDPNKYAIQAIPSNRAQTSKGNKDYPLLTAGIRLGLLRNCRFLQMVPALKSCDLAESESSVDRMYKRHLVEQEGKEFDNRRYSQGLAGSDNAVKALVAGTMTCSNTAEPERAEDPFINGTSISSLYDDKKINIERVNTVEPMYLPEDRHYYPTAAGFTEISNANINYPAHRFQTIFPQGQNSLDIPQLRRYRKQRAPIPPSLKGAGCIGSIQDGGQMCCQKGTCMHNLVNEYPGGYTSQRGGRTHSVGSTMDDISEDFRQVIQIGSTYQAAGSRNKSTQTVQNEPIGSSRPHKLAVVDQQIQTTLELLTADDLKDYPELLASPARNPTAIGSVLKTSLVQNVASIIRQNDIRGRGIDRMPIRANGGNKPFLMTDRSTQSDRALCKECMQRQEKHAGNQKKRTIAFLGKRTHNSDKIDVIGATNVATILGEHDELTRQSVAKQAFTDPLQLEVTEKTTTVECTVTVTAEGKSVSAVARPAICSPGSTRELSCVAAGNSNQSTYCSSHSPSPSDIAIGPRPYCRHAEFRRLDNSYGRPLYHPANGPIRQYPSHLQGYHTADAAVGTASALSPQLPANPA